MYSKKPQRTEKRSRFDTRAQRKARKLTRLKALQLAAFSK